MNDPKFSEAVCSDGAAILRDGRPMTISEILGLLRQGAESQQRIRELEADNEYLWLQGCKAELKLKITVSIAVGLASAFFVWLLL